MNPRLPTQVRQGNSLPSYVDLVVLQPYRPSLSSKELYRMTFKSKAHCRPSWRRPVASGAIPPDGGGSLRAELSPPLAEVTLGMMQPNARGGVFGDYVDVGCPGWHRRRRLRPWSGLLRCAEPSLAIWPAGWLRGCTGDGRSRAATEWSRPLHVGATAASLHIGTWSNLSLHGMHLAGSREMPGRRRVQGVAGMERRIAVTPGKHEPESPVPSG